ncbi:proline iminopeptidase [Balneicella halophila]|uniref:Proline iminopeptidase n=1 Tax=Balneicella halophila TaxID=1537566 RepID=A0A7L4URZ3_BALHA|nr:alpha/beta fold hydrolase [Balneicella halophila]PVX52548.1 proline iminopeptidase [Balneicella halophila]
MKKLIALLSVMLIVSIAVAQPDDKNIFDKFIPQKIQVNGYNINVETLGEGDPVFFFAGGPGNSHDYMQGNFGHYYKTHQVVFIDMLGCGLSDEAKDKSEYSVQNDAYTVEEVRKALGLDKITVVGHSYGTVVAQAYATTYPENVNKMVLISGFHSGEMWQANCDSYNALQKKHFPEIWEKVDSLRNLGYISSDPEFSKVYGSLPLKHIYYHDTSLQQNVPNYPFKGWALDVYNSIIGRDADFFVSGSMMDTDFRRKLKDLDFPTLIIAGRYDGVSTSEFNVQYKEFMPQAQFVMFENSSHNPYLEEPEKFYKLLDEFLNK